MSIDRRTSMFSVKLVLDRLYRRSRICTIGLRVAIGMSRTSFIDSRYRKGKRSFATLGFIFVSNLAALLIYTWYRACLRRWRTGWSLIIIVSARFFGISYVPIRARSAVARLRIASRGSATPFVAARFKHAFTKTRVSDAASRSGIRYERSVNLR